MSVLTDSNNINFEVCHYVCYFAKIFNARYLLFSAVISQHFSKNRMIISVVAAKIWYLKKCTVFIGPPCNHEQLCGVVEERFS